MIEDLRVTLDNLNRWAFVIGAYVLGNVKVPLEKQFIPPFQSLLSDSSSAGHEDRIDHYTQITRETEINLLRAPGGLSFFSIMGM